VPAFGTVGGITAGKLVPPDDAFKTAALGGADGVHIVTDRENGGSDDIAGLHVFGKVAEFLDAFDGHALLFFDVAEQGLGETLFFLVIKAELDGIISILARLRLHLKHAVGAGLHDGHGDQHTLRVIDAGATEFFS